MGSEQGNRSDAMKEIKLTLGQIALVDDEDFEYLNQWKWCAHLVYGSLYYAVRRLHGVEVGLGNNRIMVRMHRVIMNPPPGLVIDHINHNGLDNRRVNLRICTRRENHQNMVHKNRTGFVGVYKNYNKYYSLIRIKGKRYNLGSFNTPEEAHAAYLQRVNDVVQNREI